MHNASNHVDPGAIREAFLRDGYILRRQVVDHQAIDQLLNHVLDLLAEQVGTRFADARGPEIASFLRSAPTVCSQLYDAVRQPPWLADFARSPGVVVSVRTVLGGSIDLLRKIPLRIDVPFEMKELAVWHQDCWYVRGSLATVTAWIPLQDTSYLNGCLLVMPGSHLLGTLQHDTEVLGKRHVPSGIFERHVRYLEMRAGDLLLFDSRLLHSSGVNLSQSIRFSVNARFVPSGEPSDPSMGGVIPLGGPQMKGRSG